MAKLLLILRIYPDAGDVGHGRRHGVHDYGTVESSLDRMEIRGIVVDVLRTAAILIIRRGRN